MLLTDILKRQGIRSDKMWGSWLLFREPFRRIPFYMDVYALSKSQYWPREELKKLRLERFKETVKHAATIPFWRKRFEQAGVDPYLFTESDIARIPILTKKDFLESSIEEYTVPALLPQSREYHTSGSTGKPLTFYHDHQFELRSSGVSERMFLSVAEGRQVSVIFMKNIPNMGFEYAPHTFFHIRGYNSVKNRVRELQRVVLTLQKEVVLFGLSSLLLELARVCSRLKISLPVAALISTGETLSATEKKYVEKIFKTQVFVSYGASEIRRLGSECAHHRLHINEESLYLEITDEYGTPLPAGTQGRIVVTGFENRVMLFIRYGTGDIGTIHDEPCPCGRTLRTLEFKGRQTKLLDVGDGRTLSLLDFSYFFGIYFGTIKQFQIVRTDQHSFTMLIIPTSRFTYEILDKLESLFKDVIHPAVEIEWKMVDAIPEGPNGKALYFIDEYEKATP